MFNFQDIGYESNVGRPGPPGPKGDPGVDGAPGLKGNWKHRYNFQYICKKKIINLCLRVLNPFFYFYTKLHNIRVLHPNLIACCRIISMRCTQHVNMWFLIFKNSTILAVSVCSFSKINQYSIMSRVYLVRHILTLHFLCLSFIFD